MKIESLRRESAGKDARASARVVWETADRAPFELFFETTAGQAGPFDASANAFLTACYLPAIRHGEARIRVEGEACPRLAAGLGTAAALLEQWWGPPRRPIPIEAAAWSAPVPAGTPREALFLTGGVDSLALLHQNRASFRPGDRGSFADALHVEGLLFPGPDSESRGRHRARVRRALDGIARAADVALVEVRTNLRDLEPDQRFLADEWIAPALASAAHLFGRRWSGVTFASGRDIPHLQPRGTHPLLDPCFSTAATEIRHSGIRFSRLEKLRSMAGWTAGIGNLLVCFDAPDGEAPNCGRCEKCVRTMAELAAIGRLDAAAQFPESRLRPESVRALSLTALVLDYWEDLLPALAGRGESDLVEAIRERLAAARKAEQWLAGRNWSGPLRSLDHRWLGGALLRMRRRIRRRAASS